MDTEDNNRRSSYRLDDRISLKVSLYDANQPVPEPEKYLIAKAAFAEIEQEYMTQLTHLEQDQATLAQMIKGVNRKLDVLMRICLSEHDDHRQIVNLSATGMAFHSAEQYQAETELLLQVTLYPNYDFLRLVGKVVRVDNIADKAPAVYRVAVDFKDLTVHDEQCLNRHIFRKQAQANRAELED